MSRRVRWTQVLINRYFRSRKLGYRPLKLDGRMGPTTKRYIRLARYFLGVGPGNVSRQSAEVTDHLINALKAPRARIPGHSSRRHAVRLANARRRQGRRRRKVAAAKRAQRRRIRGTSPGHPHWGGSRYVIEETLPVARRYGAPLTSTKRAASHPLSRSNPGSDHNTANVRAYAHDYATWRPGPLSTAIRRHFGNMTSGVGTYAAIYVRRGGRVYRVQTLAGVRGHHDHQHSGARPA